MADRISDSLIDEILNSTKKYNVSEVKDSPYPISDIDMILEDVKNMSFEPKVSAGGSSVKKDNVVPQEDVMVKDVVSTSTPVEEKLSFQLEKKEKIKRNFSFDISKIEGIKDDSVSEESIPITFEENGQMEIFSNSGNVPVEEEIAKEVVEEVKPVSGQISIEKTRMFNEVDIRGTYNPNISHNLGNKVTRTTSGDAEPLSSPVMNEEKYRKHFFNKPVQKIESTQEQRIVRESLPQRTIETPGVVVKNRKSTQEDGITPVPTLVPAEYEYEQEKTRFITDIVKEKEDDNQIRFDGFDENEEILQQSEEQAEAELRENRKDKVKDFVDGNLIFKQEVDEEEEPVRKKRYERQRVSVIREYYGPKDSNVVRKVFETEKRGILIKLIATSIICFTMSLLSIIAGAQNGNFELYGNNEFVYSFTQLLFLLVASVMCARSFKNAIRNIKNLIVDIDTVVVVSALVGVIQCAVSFAFADSVESVAKVIAGAAVIPMVLKLAGDYIRCKNDSENFEVLVDNVDNCYSVENIADEDTANEIARGLMLGNPEIKYSAKIGFPQKFVELSRSADITGAICKIAVPLVLAVGLILGVVAAVMAQNIFVGVSAFSATVLMSLPVTTGVVSAINLRATNKILNEENALINGYSAVEDAVNSNGVIIDACNAFEKGGCNIEGLKTYHKMRIDEAILYTASVVIASGGVLAEVFSGVIDGKKELLLPVESLAYEEKLGCSCWIHNHRVLVGNRDLLVHHNVETPDKELEDKYKSAGKNVLYLAIEGKISAMFIVVYKANQETAEYMQELEKDGLTIFFRTSDANITEKFLEAEFGLPENVVKIINPVAGDMYTKISHSEKERSDARIIHDGRIKSMVSALHGAFVINSFVNSSKMIQLIASVIGVIIMAVLTFLSGVSQIGVVQILVYQAIWGAILTIPALSRKK